MPYFCFSELKFEKTIVIFEINNPELVHYELLINFDTGSTFSKGPGSAILEGLGPVLVYKVCKTENHCWENYF